MPPRFCGGLHPFLQCVVPVHNNTWPLFQGLGGGAGAVSHLFQGAGCTGCTAFLFQGRVSLQLQLGQLPGELLLQGSFPCSFLRGQPGPALGPGPGLSPFRVSFSRSSSAFSRPQCPLLPFFKASSSCLSAEVNAFFKAATFSCKLSELMQGGSAWAKEVHCCPCLWALLLWLAFSSRLAFSSPAFSRQFFLLFCQVFHKLGQGQFFQTDLRATLDHLGRLQVDLGCLP